MKDGFIDRFIRRLRRIDERLLEYYLKDQSVSDFLRTFPTIFIFGFARSGKSIIASEMRERHGFAHLSTDRIVKDIDKENIMRFFRAVIRARKKGLVVEGDAILDEGLINGDANAIANFETSMQMFRKKGARVLLVGWRDVHAESKIDKIKSYRRFNECWTSRYNEKEIEYFVDRGLRHSEFLKEISEKIGMNYISIGTNTFERDIDRVISFIIDTNEDRDVVRA